MADDGGSPTFSRRQVLAAGALGAAATGLPAAARAASDPSGRPPRGAIDLPAGPGVSLVVDVNPFRISLVEDGGRVVLAGLPGAGPGSVPGVAAVNGPQPADPAGGQGAFPGLGFLLGVDGGVEFPATYWTGNRLLGAAGGLVVAAARVSRTTRLTDTVVLSLETTVPAAGPALLAIGQLAGGGIRLDVRPPAGLPVAACLVSFASPATEALYGLGARKDAFNQRGLLRTVWTEEENVGAGPLGPVTDPVLGSTYTFPNGAQAAYYVQAALFGGRGWAAWITDSPVSQLDLAAVRPDVLRWGVASPRLTLCLAGGGLEAASAAFTASCGRAPTPPSYVFRPWMDVINQQNEGDASPNGGGFTGGAAVRARVEEVVARSAAAGIPLGVVGVEGWQAVPGMAGLAATLRARGLHLSAYWNAFVSPSSAAYPEALARDVLVKDPRGQPFPLLDNRNSVTYVVDFSAPAALDFWAGQLARSLDLGFEAFMEDYGEYVVTGMRFADGRPASAMHNAYPVLYHRTGRAAVDAYARAHPGVQPFFYVRSGYSQVGRVPGVTSATPGVFPGDETTDYSPASGLASVVPAMLNAALGGVFTFTSDVGGYLDLYTPQTTAELLVRWSQLAAFTAVSRIHNSTEHGSVYPWSFDSATLDTYRRYARAKVRLIPLVAHWSRRASREGVIGPVRPLVLDDPAAMGVADEWLLGTDILVAPVLTEGTLARAVYLPAGASWQQVRVADDGRFVPLGPALAGGREVRASAPLADIPIFLRRR